MSGIKNILKRMMYLSLMAGAGFVALISSTQTGAALAATAPPLGVLQQFGAFGGSGVTGAAGAGVIVTGDVGSSPTATITNFPPSTAVSGVVHFTNDGVVQQARLDATAAALDLASQAPGILLPAQLNGQVLTPGSYSFSSTADLAAGGTLTLNGSGIFVFNVNSALTANVLSNVVGTADPCNVFWRVGTDATLNGDSFFGTVIAATGFVTVGDGASVTGRVVAATAVTMAGAGGNTIGGCRCPLITLLPTVLPTGSVNIPYSQTITASGGAGPYTFTLTSGSLPPGLSPITSSGLISGTPTTAGTFTFAVTATDQNGCTGSQEYTLVINPAGCPPITLLPTVLPPGTVNNPYSQTITASGGAGPYIFTMSAGTLPPGLSPITSSGLISGTPTAAGTFTFTVTATDQNGCTGLQEYTLIINPAACPPITLLPTVLPSGTVNNPYSQTITASGGTGPYTFAMTAGTLPPGLLPVTSGGLISGTPTAAGTFTFTVTATDINGCTGLREYTLIINPAGCPPITLLPTVLPTVTVNNPYSQTITASGGAGPYTFTMTSGSLPPGLSPITSGGLISGTPTAAGTFTFTVTATDINGCTGLRAYTVTVAPVAAVITDVPTLSEWGMIIFMALGGLMSIYFLRKRKV